MPVIRSDLDGVRLYEVDKPDVWLVFFGKKHRVENPVVYESIFLNAEGLLLNPGIAEIESGPDLVTGTCLVRFEGMHQIFLLTIYNNDVVLIEISSYESFVDFGFSMEKVKNVPKLFFSSAKFLIPISSAPDRAAKK